MAPLVHEIARSVMLPPAQAPYTLGGMCSRVQCPTCHRPTYAGCGAHVEQVLGDVPPAERCRCDEQPTSTNR